MQMLESEDMETFIITIFQVFIKLIRDMEQPEKEQRRLQLPDFKANQLTCGRGRSRREGL